MPPYTNMVFIYILIFEFYLFIVYLLYVMAPLKINIYCMGLPWLNKSYNTIQYKLCFC